MKIISLRKGFQSDHSSTSYEFLAIDRKLGKEEKKAVSKLSSRVHPTSRRASFVYHGDWSDLPGGWQPLMEKYYDAMYSESYDWWTLTMAFDADADTLKTIKKYEFDGCDDLGVSVTEKGGRLVVTIYCRLMPDSRYFGRGGYDDGDYYDEEDEEETSDDAFLQLLEKNRNYLKKGDCRLLYGVWLEYGQDCEQEPPETDMQKLPKPIRDLLDMLEEA